jgi:hypothetical protein
MKKWFFRISDVMFSFFFSSYYWIWASSFWMSNALSWCSAWFSSRCFVAVRCELSLLPVHLGSSSFPGLLAWLIFSSLLAIRFLASSPAGFFTRFSRVNAQDLFSWLFRSCCSNLVNNFCSSSISSFRLCGVSFRVYPVVFLSRRIKMLEFF